MATALADDRRRRREERQQQAALDSLFGGTDLLDDEDDDDADRPAPGLPFRMDAEGGDSGASFDRHDALTPAAFQAGCDRVFSQEDMPWRGVVGNRLAGTRPAHAVDTACPKATIRSVQSCRSMKTMRHTPVTRKLDVPPAKPHRGRSGWPWAAVAGLLVLFGGGLMFRSAGESPAPSSFTAVSASPAIHSAPADAVAKYATKQIRDFRGFEWVLARNPEVADEERAEFEQVDYREWRWVELELTKPDGDVLKVGLGRPIGWLVVNEIEPGATTWLDLEEMGAVGYATILSVAPCPDPGPKPHPDCRLVTGVFRHSSADCVNVHIAGLDSPIGTTRNHRFWSEDRQAFVEAGHLHPGETLLTADGTPTSVLSIAPRPGLEPVYNLEVDVEHVYYVAADGMLVHNNYVNANRRLSRRCNHGYVIFNKHTGEIRKFGISSGKQRLADGHSYRGLRQVHELNRAAGKNIFDTVTLRDFSNRARALRWESETVGFFRHNLGHALPDNLRPLGVSY